MEPKGNLKFHSIQINNRPHAIYYKVRFEDEDGNLFDDQGSQFRFDLIPISHFDKINNELK